jgi:hypothetical protein
MTRTDLFDVVYRFHPRGVFPYERRHVPPGEPVYDDTEEHRRLLHAAARAREAYPTWKAMISRLAARYHLQNDSLHLLAGGPDPAYSARIYLPGAAGEITLTFHVCILGPYYGVHRTGDPGEEPAASEVAREIEATYPGYQPIPPEIGDEVVPDAGPPSGPFGEATIHEFLFSEVWRWAGVRKPAP